MPDPQLLRMRQIDFVGFVEEGANQEDGEGAYIKIWKRAESPEPTRRKKMSDAFDTKDLSEDVQKAFADLEEAKKAAEDATEAAETAATETGEKLTKAEADLAEAIKSEDPDKDKDKDLLKGLPDEVQKVLAAQKEKSDEAIAKAQSEAEEATKKAEAAGEVAKVEREKRQRKEFADVAKNDMSGLNTEGLGDELYEARQVMGDEAFESHTTRLKAASEQANTAKLFEETGAVAAGTSGGAWDEVEALAKVMVEKKLAPSQAQAVTKVLEDNPKLYDRYTAEQRDA